MATTESGAVTCHGTTVSTTAETASLTKKVKEVRISNREAVAGETLYVTVATGRTAAAAEAAIVTAVADADETIAIVGGDTKTVFKSKRATYVAFGIIGDASPYSVEGTQSQF